MELFFHLVSAFYFVSLQQMMLYEHQCYEYHICGYFYFASSFIQYKKFEMIFMEPQNSPPSNKIKMTV